MSSFSQNTSMTASGGGFASDRRGVYTLRFNDADTSSRFLHFKTNCPANNNAMCVIEANGYSYATAQVIKCTWVWYPYHLPEPNGSIYNAGFHSMAPGMTPNAVYRSTDGFSCFSAAAKNLYYLGVVFNVYNANPSATGGFNLGITAYTATATAGNFY